MTNLDNTQSSEHQPARSLKSWMRSISRSRAGRLLLVLAVLLTIVSYDLHARLNFPGILLDGPSFAHSLVLQGRMAIILGFVGLLVCGVLLVIVTSALAPYLEEKWRRPTVVVGSAAGIGWAVGALIGFALVLVWSGAYTSTARPLTTIFYVLDEIILPVLLLLWTVTLARHFRAFWALGVIGLLLSLFRSLVWGLNAVLPIESGYYGTAGIANVLALLGGSLWLFWLLLLGIRCLSQRSADEPGNWEHKASRPILKVARTVGVILIGVAFVGIRGELTFTHSPPLEGEGAPAEPSFVGTMVYQFVAYYERQHPITTIQQQLTIPRAVLPLPQGVSLEPVNASGVPAQFIRAPGASSSHVILYIHGGGWTVPLQDQDRVDAAQLSEATGASVLLPDYRLLPDHPFPAGLQDCVTTYTWLRSQGVDASQIVIIGGSAGAQLTLTTAVELKQNGETLPAALVALSPPTDFAMSGESYRTKTGADPVLGNGLAENAFEAYTGHGAADVRNPLISPLYANVAGFPPTLLMVGTQEILLSDSIRMAGHLKASGVEVELVVWPGMFHGFESQSYIPEAQLANEQIVSFIRRHISE